jgi:hypothetical protein
MWKISAVLLVTTAFAGLLIYNPYELPSKSVASPAEVPPRPANLVPAPAQAETAPVAEAPPLTIRPQDIQVIVRIVSEKDASGAVALPDKPVATVALSPSPASNGHQERPTSESASQTPVVQSAFASSSGFQEPPALETAAQAPVIKASLGRPSNGFQPRPALESAVQTSVARPALGRPLNGFDERTVPQGAAQTPAVQPAFGRREDSSASRLDVPIAIGGVCSGGEVIGLDPNGDNFLSVRSGPGGQPFREIDRLFSSDAVHVCGRKGLWLAVVYSPGRKPQSSCDAASKGTRRPYEGPCQYGWVHSRYIKVAAAGNLGGW